jgi:hypothetical protein
MPTFYSRAQATAAHSAEEAAPAAAVNWVQLGGSGRTREMHAASNMAHPSSLLAGRQALATFAPGGRPLQGVKVVVPCGRTRAHSTPGCCRPGCCCCVPLVLVEFLHTCVVRPPPRCT